MPLNKPFIVAEMSANHLGNYDRAFSLVYAAAKAGADAIKFQTWSPGRMCIDRSYRLDSGPWAGRALHELYEEAHTPRDWHAPLFELARYLGLIPFSAAFDRESVDFLEALGVDRHKVSSFELTDLTLIRHMASKGKPMILSTGMATYKEIAEAIQASTKPATLLCCTSTYPADASQANLAAFKDVTGWGLSDHTMGIGVAVAAATLGASYIEKHLTLSRSDGGPDAGFSMEPAEFAKMVTECRRAVASIGEIRYGPKPGESTELRRSWWAVKDIKPGDEITPDNARTARPASGIAANIEVMGLKASKFIKAGSPLPHDLL